MDDRCALCRALVDQADVSRPPQLENTRLIESERFVVMPCIGPFVLGHILIVSREHHTNLAKMGDAALVEYMNLAEQVAKRWPFATDGVLEAEHGAVAGNKAGACVVHTHIHWLPGLTHRVRMLDGLLPVLLSDVTLKELSSIHGPYIFTRANLGSTYVYEASGLRSQMIRRTLCEDLGRDDENWKAAPRPEWIATAVEHWKEGA